MNTLALPQQIFGEIMGTVNRIKGVYEKTKGVIFSMGQISEVMKQRFQSYESYSSLQNGRKTAADFEADYKKITETRQETVLNAMEALNVKYDQYTSDADFLTQLQKKAESAVGRNQILQAANQLNSFSAQQLMEIREMLMLQANLIATTAEAERAERDLERAKTIEAVQVRTTPQYDTIYLHELPKQK